MVRLTQFTVFRWLALLTCASAAVSCEASGAACVSAGGQCVIGTAECLERGPDDACGSEITPAGFFCCFKTYASTCGDNGVLNVLAADFDQRCESDADCVAIGEGNACFPCAMSCTNAAINKADEANYQTAVAKAPPHTGINITCGSCPRQPMSCCIQGRCHADSNCARSDASSPLHLERATTFAWVSPNPTV
jgi:hypothetical protein